MTSSRLRRWITWTMLAVLVLSLLVWYSTRDHLPSRIRIATGPVGGQYHEFGLLLKSILERRSSMHVELVPTEGSRENDHLLTDRKVNFAIIQGGSVDLASHAVVAPLYYDVLHLVVRKDAGIASLADLAGHRVVLGGQGSGMRHSARGLLSHHGLLDQIEEADASYFAALPGETNIDAAIITSGIQNKDLRRILASGEYKLLPVPDAAAMQMVDPYYTTFIIPSGLYREQPAVPAEPVLTLATTAFLIGNRDASDVLVEELLRGIHEEGIRLQMPTLFRRQEVRQWLDMPMHNAARTFFDPQDEIGHISAVMESLAATKELLFALAAGIYLLWERWRRLKEKEEQGRFNEQKGRLDDFLSKTVDIERRQMGITDENELRHLLDEVTRIKLQALEELTHEELRGDRVFLIFLTQCSSLINKIQAKIRTQRTSPDRVTQFSTLGVLAGVALLIVKAWHDGQQDDP